MTLPATDARCGAARVDPSRHAHVFCVSCVFSLARAFFPIFPMAVGESLLYNRRTHHTVHSKKSQGDKR
jgi:hypothetical protein